MLKINVNNNATIKYLNKIDQASRKAFVAALNRTAQQGRQPVIREIQTKFNVSKGAFTARNYGSSGISIIRASERGFIAGLKAVGKGTSLKYFKPKQADRGVTVEVLKGQRKLIRGAFGVKIKRLGGNVFVREGKERFPIEKKVGPGVAWMMRNPAVRVAFDKYVAANFGRIYNGQLKRFMG
jgi:hypothetical protein